MTMKLIDFLFGWIGLLWPSRKDTHSASSLRNTATHPDYHSDDSDARWANPSYDDTDHDDADSWEVEEDMDHCYFDDGSHDDFDMF